MRLKNPAPILLALFAASAAIAADIDGKWKAQLPTPRGDMEISFEFRAEGEKLTGTVTNPMGDSEIQDGKIKGDAISFKQVFERGRTITFAYTGKVKDGEIELTREVEGMSGRRKGEQRTEGAEPGGPRGGPGGRRGGMGRKITFTAKRVSE